MTGPALHAPDLVGPTSGRRILLAVTGMTPQVLTETLFALMREGPQALPHEVHVLTTADGAERARLALLSEQPGWFHRLRADYDLPPIAFGPDHLHVVRDADGRPLPDLRTAADNACAADQIAGLVRRFTLDAATRLHVSLAGGRKTMGFFAGHALSLWGRAGDRLTHVLVNEPFESTQDFYYPTPYERIIQIREGKLADCARAQVTLADLPFVRLRDGLPVDLLAGATTFAEAVQAAQARLDPPRLAIDLAAQRARAAGRTFALPAAELATLAWFARRVQQGLPPLPCPKEGVPSTEHAAAYLDEYRRIRSFIDDDGRAARRYRAGMSKGDFLERKAKLRRLLADRLGPLAAQPYLIVGEGRSPMRFRLDLQADAVDLEADLAGD